MMHRNITLNRVGSVAMGAVLAVGMIPMLPPQSASAGALFAQHMTHQAWQRGESMALPRWPDAQRFPIARLTADLLEGELFILPTDVASSLGLNHLSVSALPGDNGNSVIASNCDAHAQFLADVGLGDRFVIDRRDGARTVFEIVALDVVDARRAQIVLDSTLPAVTLITCYPFDARHARGTLRYVVSARALRREPSASARDATH